MVSLGNTAISLHILQPPLNGRGGVLESQNPKCQDLPKFQLGRGGLESQNPKCQDLPKFNWGGCSGKGGLYSEVQCIMGNGHMEPNL